MPRRHRCPRPRGKHSHGTTSGPRAGLPFPLVSRYQHACLPATLRACAAAHLVRPASTPPGEHRQRHWRMSASSTGSCTRVPTAESPSDPRLRRRRTIGRPKSSRSPWRTGGCLEIPQMPLWRRCGRSMGRLTLASMPSGMGLERQSQGLSFWGGRPRRVSMLLTPPLGIRSLRPLRIVGGG